MSRVRRTSVASGFTYAQFALALIAGLLLVPYILARIGARTYGIWLASGELLGYAAMADFGLLSTLPWLVAEGHGRGDQRGLRRLTTEAFAAASLSAAAYGALAVVIWAVFPAVLRLTPGDRSALAGPLGLVAAVGAATIPLRVFSSTLVGLQDVRFNGILGLVQGGLNVALTLILLHQGAGLYALAIAAAVPGLVVAAVSTARLRIIAPALLEKWERPLARDVYGVFREGFGGWLSMCGWRLIAASDAIVLASLGRPGAVAVLACTSKIAQVLMQMAWVPSDNALVPLAELRGEGRPDHLRAAVCAALRLYLTLAGAVCCIVLAANPSFVRWWVGPELFAGRTVNLLLATAVLVVTAGHGLAVIGSATGERLRVGGAALLTGLLHVPVAWSLALRFDIAGVVLATILSHGVVLTALVLPALSRNVGIGPVDIGRRVLRPWAARLAPFAAAAAAVPALMTAAAPLWIAMPAGAVVAVLYVWTSRGLLLDFPPVATFVSGLVLSPSWLRRSLTRSSAATVKSIGRRG